MGDRVGNKAKVPDRPAGDKRKQSAATGERGLLKEEYLLIFWQYRHRKKHSLLGQVVRRRTCNAKITRCKFVCVRIAYEPDTDSN